MNFTDSINLRNSTKFTNQMKCANCRDSKDVKVSSKFINNAFQLWNALAQLCLIFFSVVDLSVSENEMCNI